MKTIARVTPVGAICMLLVGCATVTRGSSTDWAVRTEPPGATVTTSNGKGCDATPCVIRMSRKAEFTAKIEKPGYRTATVQVDHNMSTAGGVALVGNAVIGGLIGVAIDLTTGAPDDLSPGKVALNLEAVPTTKWTYQTAMNTEAWIPPAGGEHYSRIPRPSTDSRVTELKILPGGSAVELHEDGTVTETR